MSEPVVAIPAGQYTVHCTCPERSRQTMKSNSIVRSLTDLIKLADLKAETLPLLVTYCGVKRQARVLYSNTL